MINLLIAVIYLAFISLGLPDSLLGSGWPSMYSELAVPVSFAGIISMIIAIGTIISSLCSDRITRRFGAGKVTAVSVAMTTVALGGFSLSRSFFALCLLAVPYGLGAGSIDAALNNYVALHYSSSHMSWLHCMWGVGTVISPYMMEYALKSGKGWHKGYGTVSVIQAILCIFIFLSLPLWKKTVTSDVASDKPLSLAETFRLNGVKEVMITFFCYCSLESTVMLWAGSYMALFKNIPADVAAGYASMFFIGMTLGRAVNGFLAYKFSDRTLIYGGQGIIFAGIAVLLLPLGNIATLAGFVLIGLGCAPIYPCIIHSTPSYFGKEHSQAIIGVQMASAYTGTCLMPTLFGLIAKYVGIKFMPLWLLALLLLMAVYHKRLVRLALHS